MNDIAVHKKRVIMILGMARSGTSTIARGLKAAGVDLGEKMLRADSRNPKGFWEDTDVTIKINRGILRHFGFPWIFDELADHMRVGEDDMLMYYKHHTSLLVRERLQNKSVWAFKDTNTTVLLPFWQTILNELGVEDCYLIALRNPLSCAYSNIRHSNLELEAGLLAWLKNIILGIDGSHGRRRIVVSYENMVTNPQYELSRLRHGLVLPEPNHHDINEFINNFLDKNLGHHVYADDEIAGHPAIAAIPLCVKVYRLLKLLAEDKITFADNEFITEWQSIRTEFYEQYPLYLYADLVLKDNLQLQREIRAIKKSLAWKLLVPLWR
ncbi:MAG TPA: hypothetical protein VL360_04975, partial [Gammaproteobacteria bacterium]|nr:hypothetical protein [Gammaproteobacteria bacterium]